ncbi:MAG TPA: IclR family transcriptional regulator [Anaerolineae bacterium]|nr:IclR family transcriptional regulator [Anaerolineae bacterium]HOR01089.1 IclR family transcriptional regulator [Anaerolineae bacterium]HPL29943.1 IclR family transcriptional regulator [Anaerolineae bacterium]HPL29944.1 IclR family transcriptional regulator [Anaerolineae bacterium]
MSASPPRAERDHSAVQSVERTLHILDTLAAARSGLSLTELCGRTGLHTSTVYRLLATLLAHGYVRQDGERKAYRLGLHLLHIGEAARAQCDLRDEAMGCLEALARRSSELANLAIPSGNRAIYIAQAQAQRGHAIGMFTQLGAWVPLHCTAVGKAIIAHRPEAEVEHLIQEGLPAHTANTITNPLRLRGELAEVRRRGYAIDDEERELGVRCIAGPVWDADGRLVAAISISGPSGRVTPERFAELGSLVSQAAQQLSERIGYGA